MIETRNVYLTQIHLSLFTIMFHIETTTPHPLKTKKQKQTNPQNPKQKQKNTSSGDNSTCLQVYVKRQTL